MKKGIMTACCGLFVYAAFTMGCMDRKPAPVCPVPTEVNQTDFQASGFDGVDLLVVVDNSVSMTEEQEILATGFFTLINSLVNPLSDWPFPPVDDLRVAVVSSDMGLQYGAGGLVDESPTVNNCDENGKRGDNGEFQLPTGGTITVASNVIQCEVDGGQCPCENGGSGCPGIPDWSCSGASGTCAGPALVNCPSNLFGGEDWAENTEGDNLDINREVACMSNLGNAGCGFEQQLEASVKGLSITPDFMTPGHLLAVLVVSDEEDCSIEDPGLFTSAEWDIETNNAQLVNVACNWHDGQPDDQYLFATSRYLSEWTRLKGGSSSGVVFASIVGVPQKDTCQGAGNALSACLDESEMQYSLRQQGDQYFFNYACQREEVTKATPGRRYVQVAEELGENGYVYSICNEDWSPAMADIASLIAEAVGQSCYTDSLVWVPLRKSQQEEQDCQGCGAAVCNMVYEYEYPCEAEEELKACEERFVAANDEEPICNRDFFEDVELTYEMVEGDADIGTGNRMVVDCVVIKLPAPFDCGGPDGADAKYQGEDAPFGWYYCENQDCGDDGTDPSGADCCKYGINFTASAEEASAGRTVKVQCLEEFTFEDPNCQENTQQACNDDIDNDGNGVWDCDTDLSPPDGGTPHRADRNCCVVDANCDPIESNYGEGGLCPHKTGGDVLADHSGACLNQMVRCCLDYSGDSTGDSGVATPDRCVWLKAQLEAL